MVNHGQLGFITERLDSWPVDAEYELKSSGERLLALSDGMEDQKRQKVAFLARQVLLNHTRRFTGKDIKAALTIYLRSRSACRALRENLVMPCTNTLQSYFGKLGIPGSEEECTNTVRRVFEGLTDNQKSCFISVDEIHIKPGISYHLIGHAVDTDTPQAATTVLAMMINPSLVASAFVGRLLPVFSLKAEFLYDPVTKMINVIHEAGGFVYLVMSDNLSVNQKLFKMFMKATVSFP